MKKTLRLLILNSIIVLGISCNKEEAKTPPNIVFIAIDDLRTELGCYGKTIVQSPNLDKFASEGILFANHFANVPTCGASRYSLLTGMRPRTYDQSRNGAIETEITGKPEGSIPETFIHHLRRQGYHTVGVGKIGHTIDGYMYDYKLDDPNIKKLDIKELPHSWDELDFDHGIWKTAMDAALGYANGESRFGLKRQVKRFEQGEVDKDTGYVDGLTTRLAISKLKELSKSSKPFFIGIGLIRPHLPFNAPAHFWDLYDRDSIPVSPNPDIPKNINIMSLSDCGEFNGGYLKGEEKAGPLHRVSDAYAKKLRHGYYACVSYSDYLAGKLLNEIKSLGLDKNTIVVIWGDHGWHLGDQQIWGKHTVFDNALKSTLMMQIPEKYSSGITNQQVVSSIVETVDLYPTLMDLCNVEMPPYKMHGESLISRLKGEEVAEEDNVAYGYYREGVSMRNERYRLTKYFRNEQPVVELYDHETDPLESVNVADDHPEIVKKLMPLWEKGNTGLYEDR